MTTTHTPRFWQILVLRGTSSKLEQENKFMTEALEDLQDSTSRLEAENRTLKNSSPIRRTGASGSGSSSKVGNSIIFVRAAEVARGIPKSYMAYSQSEEGLVVLAFCFGCTGWTVFCQRRSAFLYASNCM